MGFLMAVGSAVFIGCPIKAVLRLAAGDFTAWPGFIGLIIGVWVGIRLLATGELTLGQRSQTAPTVIPLGLVAGVVTLAVLAFWPGFLAQSVSGGGSLHAPAEVSLGAGLVLGVACQRSRFCITGSIRDFLLTRSFWPIAALGAALMGAFAANGFTGQLSVGYHNQPGSHLEWVWSFVGMGLVGLVAVLAGGCPFRQIIKAGEGDLDAVTVVVGMVIGAALIQNWDLGATAAGVPPGGKVAVLLGMATILSLGLARREESV
jgi:hypothetical protein